MSFKGKVVLITGAASGIGANAALHLAELGAEVSMVDINKDLLIEVADQIIKSGSPTPLTIVADVTQDTDRIVDETIKKFGRLDVLVNNAGTVTPDNIVNVNISDFDHTFDVNVRSIVKLTKACVPYLEKTKGNIVNVSSIASLQEVQNIMSNSMSKAAIDRFTKCSALDLAPKRIRCNIVHPGAIRTPIFKAFGMNDEEIDAFFEDLAKDSLVGRGGEVSDLSEAIAYLANDKSGSFLTGVSLPVDGGSLIAGSNLSYISLTNLVFKKIQVKMNKNYSNK